MDIKNVFDAISKRWEESILPALEAYIRIPNKSPAYDSEWKKNGHMDKAVQLIAKWCKEQGPSSMQIRVIETEGRTPLLWMEVPGTLPSEEAILLYGHLDKQPEMEGWNEDLGPWKPVLRDNKLYGRGGADDGYAAFATVTALKVMEEQGIPFPRCVILIEACEESGSDDLPYYVEQLKSTIGNIGLVICLDSGCGNYEQLWVTTSLRGVVMGELKVQVLHEGMHSGTASGIVPSSFRIIRQLLDRVEDKETGKILIKECYVDIPPERVKESQKTAEVLGSGVVKEFPFTAGTKPIHSDLTELLLNKNWRPTLTVIGADGLPPTANAGNVLWPYATLKLSFRLPPGCEPEKAAHAIKTTLEQDPPYGAKVSFSNVNFDPSPGWEAPSNEKWLANALDEASNAFFGKSVMYMGEGGTIPFMGMLGRQYPKAQFVVTGLLGPHSNAHGPNEFLEIPMAKRLTACVVYLIEAFGRKGHLL